jgi:hypothetical protein
MSVFTMANAKIYIGTTTVADDLTSYEADTYAEIGEAQTISGLVDTQNFTTFAALGDSRVRNLKTTRAGESVTLTCGYDPEDAGQIALRAASLVTLQTNYNFKVVYNDDASNKTTVYWSGLVGNDSYPGGSNEDVALVEFMLTNNTGFVVEVRT